MDIMALRNIHNLLISLLKLKACNNRAQSTSLVEYFWITCACIERVRVTLLFHRLLVGILLFSIFFRSTKAKFTYFIRIIPQEIYRTHDLM